MKKSVKYTIKRNRFENRNKNVLIHYKKSVLSMTEGMNFKFKYLKTTFVFKHFIARFFNLAV